MQNTATEAQRHRGIHGSFSVSPCLCGFVVFGRCDLRTRASRAAWFVHVVCVTFARWGGASGLRPRARARASTMGRSSAPGRWGRGLHARWARGQLGAGRATGAASSTQAPRPRISSASCSRPAWAGPARKDEQRVAVLDQGHGPVFDLGAREGFSLDAAGLLELEGRFHRHREAEARPMTNRRSRPAAPESPRSSRAGSPCSASGRARNASSKPGSACQAATRRAPATSCAI